MKEALIVLDVIRAFEHDDGDRRLASMRERLPSLSRALSAARRRMAVIYVNDTHGVFDGDAPGHVARARAAKGGEVAREPAPASSLDRENERIALASLENVTGSVVVAVDAWELQMPSR